MNAAEILIKIIKSVCEGTLLSKDVSAAAGECLDEVCHLARKHDLEHFVDMGLHGTGVLREEKKTVLHYDSVFRNYSRYQKLLVQGQKLFDLLEQHGIDYLPLKGAVIRAWYPEPWMRTSCDIDILIREEDLAKAEKLLSQNGYEKTANGVHDICFAIDELLPLELHFNLLEENEKIDPMLAKVWQFSERKSGHRWEMRNDFFFFYLLAHIEQHLMDGGCGIRPFLDLWIICKTPLYNEKEVRALCDEAGLGRFMEQVLHLTNVWFGDGEHTDLTKTLASFILEGGAFGTDHTLSMARKGSSKGGLSLLWSRLFIPPKRLEVSLQVKKVTGWNYLYYSLRRILLIGRKENFQTVKREMKNYQTSSETKGMTVEQMMKELNLI